jgi:hypothetical protein
MTICIIFLTHNFKNEFINTLEKIDNDPSNTNYEIIVLFDNANDYDISINSKFKNIKIIKISKLDTQYDPFAKGHTMYINYFKQNYDLIQKYEYIWIVENDVYYPNSMLEFMNIYKNYNYDLLVSEYGVRDVNWYWRNRKHGFKTNVNVGVYAFIMRLSQKLLYKIIDNLDINYFGYLEVILPHICIENNLSIQQFIPDTCGIVTVDNNDPFINLVKTDIINKTRNFIGNKIYHPIKL